MTTNEYAVIQVGCTFFGVGATPEAAITDALRWLDDDTDADEIGENDQTHGALAVVPVTAALAAAIRDDGADAFGHYEYDSEARIYRLDAE